MKLTRLEIYGFKSFAKKLDLRLTGGITAVVGPNGCGKTNVVDAIRWVLGELRPSQLRLDGMDDVLFKGSSTRRPLGMAEVSLTIENLTGVLPVDMPEVTITRRLFRSGESEYLINRKTCRLADINDLLMDTGMGTDSYSVFELGMINAIISDKTDDRRHIFEEAAGVTKYKARRKSALNKLVGIEDDIARVNDIVGELTRRTESLKRQAARAARYRTLKSEIKARTLALAAWEIAAIDRNRAGAVSAIDEVRDILADKRRSAARAEEELERLAVDMVAAERELAEASGNVESGAAAIAEREKELARIGARLEALAEMAARAREESRRNSAAVEKVAVAQGDCAGALADAGQRLGELEGVRRDVAAACRAAQEALDETGERFAELERGHRLLEQETASMAAALERERETDAAAQARLDTLATRRATLDGTVKTLTEERKSITHDIERLTAVETDAAEELDGIREDIAARTQERESFAAGLATARERHAALTAEHAFLDDIVRSHEGYGDGVKSVMAAEGLRDGILGVFGDRVAADAAYAPAVEAVLGERLRSVIVRTGGDAAAGVRHLREQDGGRAVFVPVEDAGAAGDIDEPTGPGIIGKAASFVRADGDVRAVVERLLGAAYIVDDLETARRLHALTPGTVFVTPTGDCVGVAGDVAGGSAERADHGSVLGRGERLDALEDAVHEAGDAVDAGARRLHECDEMLMVLRSRLESRRGEIDAARRDIAALGSRRAGTTATLDAAERDVAAVGEEMAATTIARDERVRRMAELTTRLDASRKACGEAGERVRRESSDVGERRAGLETLRAERAALDIEHAGLAEKKAGLERELAALDERRESLVQSSKRTLADIENAENESLETGERKQDILAGLERLGRDHEAHRTVRDDVERHFAALRTDRSDREAALSRLRRETDEVARRESALALARDEAQLKRDAIITRMMDEYYIRPEDMPGAPEDDEFSVEGEKARIDELREKLHGIGDVNLAAEADYEEEKKRLDFLVYERDDLIGAGGALKDTIGKINDIATARFMETFNRIRINFQKMFREFFEGGECDLELEPGIDPLEASIRIIVHPPGKNVRAINLLSSGERALTAISMLFAIYLVKPSPFCILDEVDAPLDDSNLDRYLRVIRDFSHKTQFIMVTHNKRSMAEADNLYGITMGEPGLSTLVSVRLSEIDAPGEGGEAVEEEPAGVV